MRCNYPTAPLILSTAVAAAGFIVTVSARCYSSCWSIGRNA